MEIVIINGTPGSGKDEFVKQSQKILGDFRCYNYSTIDFVKFVAICAGWKQDKTPENRRFLSDLKKLLTTWDDVPLKKTLAEVRDCHRFAEAHECLEQSVMFIHCREPEEIERLMDCLGGYNCHTLLVKRAAADEIEQSNESDARINDYAYEAFVINDGTIEDLAAGAQTYIEEILGLTI